MQKNWKHFEFGSYEVEFDPEATRKAYESVEEKDLDEALQLFYFLLKDAKKESLAFLESLGLLPHRIPMARPLAPPDEEGNVLFLCTARLCGRILRGGDTRPRQSEEEAGISMVFVSDPKEFTPGLDVGFDEETEIRFVMELLFDPSFFEGKE